MLKNGCVFFFSLCVVETLIQPGTLSIELHKVKIVVQNIYI